ncbi:putative aminodeoxychorismate lyase [Marinomonas aquimarina]|uniref:Endolytic murein transglycosylase n=1 Tax=Marinomonas aquimarina TaxID=295068 RepID=A0A1A8TSW2_9GAMM|nr:endolytic transglycosylase MltG [Marinomonas aquimarina]SBS36407.1 putative aminodeoxychorismate lyase [Marinomonas aquimarina]
MKVIKWLALTALVALTLAAVAAGWAYNALTKPMNMTEVTQFDVTPGTSIIKLGNTLADKGWIEHPLLARLAYQLNPQMVPKVGKYEIQPGMNLMEALVLFDSGDTVFYPITLLEGHTFREYLAAMQAKGNIEMTLLELSDKEIAEKLGLEQDSPEGMLFANTYRYHDGDTDLDILKQSHQLLQAALDELWSNKAKNLPYKTPYEALIMASIIEKETGVPAERPLIARVFISRLEKGMRLQTDPTVIYGMGERYNGNITRADLRRHTPYNTYQINGLPPTPIANVGKEAIHAALNPGETKALYFVAKGDGSHVFSNTLREHNAAVAEFQRFKRRKDYTSTPTN